MGEAEYNEIIVQDPRAAAKLFLEKDREIEKLRNHLINATKAQFGAKSEKLSAETQQGLFPLDELVSPPTQEELPHLEVPVHKRSVQRKRREIPPGTPVRRIEHSPKETTCTCCGSSLVVLREEITKILNYLPARFELEEHVRPVMACNSCRESAPVATSLPKGIQLIERSPAGVGLLSYIVISKYQDHLPLYRLEQIFARLGFELPRNRMCEWLGHLAEALHPLYKAIKRELFTESYLQADETTIKIQDGEQPEVCHTGYFWGLVLQR